MRPIKLASFCTAKEIVNKQASKTPKRQPMEWEKIGLAVIWGLHGVAKRRDLVTEQNEKQGF